MPWWESTHCTAAHSANRIALDSLQQRIEHTLYLDHIGVDAFIALRGEEPEITCQQELVFHFISRAKCDLKGPPEFRLGSPTSFRQIRSNR